MAVNNSNTFSAFMRICKLHGVRPTIERWESLVWLLSAWRLE